MIKLIAEAAKIGSSRREPALFFSHATRARYERNPAVFLAGDQPKFLSPTPATRILSGRCGGALDDAHCPAWRRLARRNVPCALPGDAAPRRGARRLAMSGLLPDARPCSFT